MKKPIKRRDNKQRQIQKSIHLNQLSNSSNGINVRNILFDSIQKSLPEYNTDEKSIEKSYSEKEINLLKYNNKFFIFVSLIKKHTK